MSQSNVPQDNPLELLATYCFYIPNNEHYPEHTHNYHELVVVQRGRLRVRFLGGEHLAAPGDILLYPTGTIHEEWAEDNEPVLTWVCMFRGDEMGPPVFCHDAHGHMQELISKLTWRFLVSRFPRKGDPEHCMNILKDIVKELRCLASHEPQAMVDRVRTYILSHIKEPFTLDDLSAISGLSKYHFVRQYRVITGRTPMEDARFLRVAQAHHLIVGTALPLHEIGPLVGIQDEFHLSRLLKTVFGMGARELRQSGLHSK